MTNEKRKKIMTVVVQNNNERRMTACVTSEVKIKGNKLDRNRESERQSVVLIPANKY